MVKIWNQSRTFYRGWAEACSKLGLGVITFAGEIARKTIGSIPSFPKPMTSGSLMTVPVEAFLNDSAQPD
jgi:hypothetical protein